MRKDSRGRLIEVGAEASQIVAFVEIIFIYSFSLSFRHSTPPNDF